MSLEDVIDKIICGDCIEIMKSIPDETIHMIITSPPYNVGMPYGVADDTKNYTEYLSMMENCLKECYRILIKGGRIAINLPASILQSTKSRMSYLSLDIVLLMRKVGYIDREWIGWIKMPKGEIPGKSTSWGSWCSPSCPYCRDAMEYIIVMDKITHKRTDKKGKNDITSKEFLTYTSNCWYIQPESTGEVRNNHPAPFPEELPYRLIKLYTWEDDIVLDPFVGSGTTAVTAKKLNRHFIGIDISQEYCEFAIKRLNETPRPFFK